MESLMYAMLSFFSGEDVDALRSKIQLPSCANIRRNMLITAEGRHEQLDAALSSWIYVTAGVLFWSVIACARSAVSA